MFGEPQEAQHSTSAIFRPYQYRVSLPKPLTDNFPDDAPLQAALYAASPDGSYLNAEAEHMVPGIAAHNALARLAALAGAHLSPDVARLAAALAWTQATLRKRAVEKLGEEIGSVILFDSDGLQMSSGIVTARYHAELALRSRAEFVVDMTAGVGVDSLVFARAGVSVIAYEINPARAALLSANVERFGLSDKIEVRQANSLEDKRFSRAALQNACVYLDPPRRDGASRWGGADMADAMLRHALQRSPAGVLMKLSPAAERAMGKKFDADMEYISVDGECREALLRWGAVCRSDPHAPELSAVTLPAGNRLSSDAAYLQRESLPAIHLEQGRYLYEPDAAIIRAGLTGQLAAEQSWTQFDDEVAYLISESLAESPLAQGYQILAALPYHKRAVQAWLDEQGATHLIVKKRGVPDEPEVVRRSYKLKAAGKSRRAHTAILALTKQGKQLWALFLERL